MSGQPSYETAARELADAVRGLLQNERLAKTCGVRGDVDKRAWSKARCALRTYKQARGKQRVKKLPATKGPRP